MGLFKIKTIIGREEKWKREKGKKQFYRFSLQAEAGCNSLECLSNPPQPQINYNWKPLPVFTGFHHKKIPRPTLSLLAPNCTCLEEIVLTHLGGSKFYLDHHINDAIQKDSHCEIFTNFGCFRTTETGTHLLVVELLFGPAHKKSKKNTTFAFSWEHAAFLWSQMR